MAAEADLEVVMQLMEVQEDLVEDQININQLEVETLVDTLHLKAHKEVNHLVH